MSQPQPQSILNYSRQQNGKSFGGSLYVASDSIEANRRLFEQAGYEVEITDIDQSPVLAMALNIVKDAAALKTTTAPSSTVSTVQTPPLPTSELQPGVEVYHPHFRNGVIAKSDNPAYLNVLFDDFGLVLLPCDTKTLYARVSK